MPHRYFRRALLPLLLLVASLAHAQLEPAARYTVLSATQLLAWTPTGPTALPANVSAVPLAPRQNALAPQLNPNQSFSAKVSWAPDGMDNFAGYLNEQNKFNLYNFTHWQYIDVLIWFTGQVGIPCRPWMEAAHRNGVKIVGSVFVDGPGFIALSQRDAGGDYPAAQKLVDVANYYGFDGWFFNQESRISAAQATELANMLRQLQLIKPAGMEIHWYDSMLPSGAIAYQNTLNTANAPLLQAGTARVSDAMFTNYFWNGANAFNTAVTTASAIGRSPFDVYSGADIWPGRNPQQLFNNTAWISNFYTANDPAQPRTSMGIFAANLTYNGGLNTFVNNPAAYADFYNTEVRLFAGNDLDVTTPDAGTAWKGFGHYQPVRSVINALPFETNFCVGQGRIFATNGVQTAKDWTDMAKQRVLPSWQWAKTGAAGVRVGFDFARAYSGGTSVKLAGTLAAGAATTVKLYQTKLAVGAATSLEITYQAAAAGPSNAQLELYFSDNLAVPELLSLPAVADTLWATQVLPLAAYAGRELAIVGLRAASAAPVPAYRLSLGRLKIYNGPAAAVRPMANFTAVATAVTVGQPVSFVNQTPNATSFVWTFAGGSPASSTAIHPVVTYAAPGTYAVKLRAESAAGRDSLTRTAYISVTTPAPPGSNTALLFDGANKYVDAGPLNLSGPALSLECWFKANTFKTGGAPISSLLGLEDGGPNTALLRLGDGGVPANQLQFVLQVGGTTRKLVSPTPLVAGTWYHVAATFDGASMKIYLDGALNASLNAPGAAVANAGFALARNYSNARCLDGALDEARAWTRALTPAEIAANACAVPPAASGLEAYWKCNEAPGLTAADATGHGHTGTLVAMTAADWSPAVPAACALLGTAPARSVALALHLLALENPVSGPFAELEIRGATGQPLTLQVFDVLGRVVAVQALRPFAGTGRARVALPAAAGLYVVRVGGASARVLRL